MRYVARPRNYLLTTYKVIFFFIAVRCKSVEAPKDGDVTPNSCTASPKYGTTCLFSCQKGYRLHGEPIATCLKDGRWSKHTTVSCKG